jgi:hypothetical protein
VICINGEKRWPSNPLLKESHCEPDEARGGSAALALQTLNVHRASAQRTLRAGAMHAADGLIISKAGPHVEWH